MKKKNNKIQMKWKTHKNTQAQHIKHDLKWLIQMHSKTQPFDLSLCDVNLLQTRGDCLSDSASLDTSCDLAKWEMFFFFKK